MHLDDKWFTAGYNELNGNFLSWNLIGITRKVIKYILSQNNDNDSD